MKHPMIPITFFYVNGIFLSGSFSISLKTLHQILLLLLIALLFLLCCKFLNNNNQNSWAKLLSWLFTASFFFIAGISSFSLVNTPKVLQYNQPRLYTVVIDEQLKPNAFQNRYYGTIIQNNISHPILIYQDIEKTIWQTGHSFIAYAAVKPIGTSKNPYQFNYAAYLAKKNIYGQIKIDTVYKILPSKKDFFYYVASVRNHLKKSFDIHSFDQDTKGIIHALLFGQRQDLSEEIEKNYRDAGVVHVLSVSGLHIGLLYYVLNFVFGLGIRNRDYRFLCVVSLLIFFAFLSGLSGPVVRSVAMFCFVGFAAMLKKNSSSIHVLVISLFFILLLYPNYVFDVGFQLSYLAVYAIIYLFPLIREYCRSNNRIINFFTEMSGISIIAQIGVLPLSLHYFGQFPLLFLIGNLLIITTTNFILIGLLLLLVLNFTNEFLALYVGYVIEYMIVFSNNVAELMSKQHRWVLTNISVGLVECMLYTAGIFTLAWWLKRHTYKKLILFFAILISLQLFYLQEFLQKKDSESYFLYDYHHFTYLEKTTANYLFYTTDTALLQNKYIHDFMRKQGKRPTSIHTIQNRFKNQSTSFLIVDSMGVYKTFEKADVIVLIDNPAINLERLLEYHEPKQLIIHPRNRAWRKVAWTKTCKQKNIPFHDMGEKGYLVFRNE